MSTFGSMGQDLAPYYQKIRPRISGVPGIITNRAQINANADTTFQLKVDTRGPFVLTRLSLSLGQVPYPPQAQALVFVVRAEADLLFENGQWNRDQLVRNTPHIFATPIGVGGLFGGKDFPVGMVVRHSSLIEVTFRETGGSNFNASLTAHGYYPTKDPVFQRLGDIQFLEPDRPGELPEPVGRCYIVGDQVNMLASTDGDLVFNLATNDVSYLDEILCSYDRRCLWDAAFATCQVNVKNMNLQYEGSHEAYKLMTGTSVNLMTVFGSNGSVGSRMFDRCAKLEPGSDVIVEMANADAANPHIVYGGAVIHRF